MQKIIIDKFRQISHAELELRDFLFLIGEQASGKSTIVKLVYFFKSLKQDYLSLLNGETLPAEKDLKTMFIRNIQDKFNVYFGFTTLLDKDFSVKYFFSEEKDFSVRLSKGNALQIRFSDDFWKHLTSQTTQLKKSIKSLTEQTPVNSKTNFTVKERLRNTIGQKKQETANIVFCDERDCLFVPAGRNITVSYPEQFQLLFFGELQAAMTAKRESNTIDLTLIKDFVSYSKLLSDYFLGWQDEPHPSSFMKVVQETVRGILHGHYKNENGYEKIFYSDNEFTPLNIASSGQQESIRIIQDAIYILTEGFKASRIIEEPETHLFPTAQKQLIQLLIMVANKTDSQVIITTHSPHVLATFNNMLYYSRVMQGNPDKRAEIEEHFKTSGFDETKAERLNVVFEKFQAYALKPDSDEYCHSIMEESNHLIGQNFIDEATEDIYDEFDFLYSLL